MPKKIRFPVEDRKTLSALEAGDLVLISGVLLAARDQTHRRLLELVEAERPLPTVLEGHCIYYVGPSPAPPGKVIGAAGPTTAYRMDAYTPRLLDLGVAATMGKGKRTPPVKEALKKAGAVYLATFGGAGAYLARCIKACEVLAFPELGPEALFRLEVEDFPAVVINDLFGRDFYEEARTEWSHRLQEDTHDR